MTTKTNICSNTVAELVRPEGVYRTKLPNWGQWLGIIDRASAGRDVADGVDIDQLLKAWLQASTSFKANDQTKFSPLGGLERLNAELADALIGAGSSALQTARETEAIQTVWDDDRQVYCLTSCTANIDIYPLSFALRNACLRQAMSVSAGTAHIDTSEYELLLVSHSAKYASSCNRIPVGELRALPLSIGEALIGAARALSDPAADQEMKTFASAGLTHPDLELASLCLAYGMSPEQAGALPAATARRLSAAAHLLKTSSGPATQIARPAYSAPTLLGDNVTQIVVNDG